MNGAFDHGRVWRLIAGSRGGASWLELSGAPVLAPIELEWFPGERITRVEDGSSRLVIESATRQVLRLEREQSGPLIVWRGRLEGLVDPTPAPIPAPSALARHYQAGGIPLLRATCCLPAADAWQRPRWQADGWTIEWLTLDPRVGAVRPAAGAGPIDGSVIEVNLYPPHRGRPAGVSVGFALLVARDEQFEPACRAVAIRENLPGAHRPADRDRVLQVARQPTLFAISGTRESNGDQLIEWAAWSGFGSILLLAHVWSRSNPAYEPNTQNWPGGWRSLRAFADRARAHGLAVGLHTLTTSVADGDSCVSPVPDERLMVVGRTRLAGPISAADRTIPLADPPVGFAAREDYMAFGKTVRIGSELMRYGAAAEKERALFDCQRGAYGTVAAPHRAGEEILYLLRMYGEFALDPESSLADATAERIARAIHETGAEMVYFDDSEAMPEPYLGHVSAFHERIWRAVGQPALHVQASSTGPYGIWLLARAGQQDTAIYKESLLDRVILPNVPRYVAAGLVPDFGWFGVVVGDVDRQATTNDDLDCLLARLTGCEAGVTVFGHPELVRTSLFQAAAQRIAAWDTVRRQPIGAATRQALATAGRVFRPVTGPAGPMLRESLPVRLRLVADETGQVLLVVNHPGPAQPLSIRIRLCPPLESRGSAVNRVLYQPDRDLVTTVSGAGVGAPVRERDRGFLPWQVTDATKDFARWRVTFPEPLDLTGHRALSLRYRIEGACQAAVVRLVSGVQSGLIGIEYALPVTPGVELVVDDPPVDPTSHHQGRWPDDWFSFTQGVRLAAVEALEWVCVGLHDRGSLCLERVEALHEQRPTGPWAPQLRIGETVHLGQAIPWDGSIELLAAGTGVQAEVREASGVLTWSGDYRAEECPRLLPGENDWRLTGLPPRARLEVRLDRLTNWSPAG